MRDVDLVSNIWRGRVRIRVYSYPMPTRSIKTLLGFQEYQETQGSVGRGKGSQLLFIDRVARKGGLACGCSCRRRAVGGGEREQMGASQVMAARPFQSERPGGSQILSAVIAALCWGVGFAAFQPKRCTAASASSE